MSKIVLKTGASLAAGVTSAFAIHYGSVEGNNWMRPDRNAQVQRCADELGSTAFAGPNLLPDCEPVSDLFPSTLNPDGSKSYLIPTQAGFLSENLVSHSEKVRENKDEWFDATVGGAAVAFTLGGALITGSIRRRISRP